MILGVVMEVGHVFFYPSSHLFLLYAVGKENEKWILVDGVDYSMIFWPLKRVLLVWISGNAGENLALMIINHLEQYQPEPCPWDMRLVNSMLKIM